jgi:hypothetical protein
MPLFEGPRFFWCRKVRGLAWTWQPVDPIRDVASSDANGGLREQGYCAGEARCVGPSENSRRAGALAQTKGIANTKRFHLRPLRSAPRVRSRARKRWQRLTFDASGRCTARRSESHKLNRIGVSYRFSLRARFSSLSADTRPPVQCPRYELRGEYRLPNIAELREDNRQLQW